MALSMSNSQELTTEQVVATLIQPLESSSIVLANSPRIYDSPTGDPLRIPSLVSTDQAAWHGENEQITEGDADFGEITLLPTNLKSVKIIHRFSNELARHSIVSIANTMQAAFVKRTADKIDDAFLNGVATLDTNGNRTPIGLFNQPGTQSSTLTLTTLALLNSVVDTVGKLLTAEISAFGSCRWFLSTDDFLKLSKVQDSEKKGFLQPDLTQPGVFRLYGIPVVVSSRVPAGTGLLADMSMVAVGRDLAPSVRLLSERYADYDQLGLRVTCRMDIGLLHPEGVVKLTVA
jgi:HK97 family phage major capsid protein